MSLIFFILFVNIFSVQAQYYYKYYNPSSYGSQPYYSSFGASGYYSGFGSPIYFGLSPYRQNFAPLKSKPNILSRLPLPANRPNTPPKLSSNVASSILPPALPSISPNLRSLPTGPLSSPLPNYLPPTAKIYYLPSSSSLMNPSINLKPPLPQPSLPQSSLPQSSLPELSLPQLPLQLQPPLPPSFLPELSLSQPSLPPLQNLPTPSYNCPFCTGSLPPANPNIPPPPAPSSILPGLINEVPSLLDQSRKPFALSLDSQGSLSRDSNYIPSLASCTSPTISSRFALPQPPCQSFPDSVPIPPPIPIKSRYDLDLLDGFLSGLGF